MKKNEQLVVSLRDAIAISAMNAIIIGNNADASVLSKNGSIGMAKDAYIVADTMLKIREQL